MNIKSKYKVISYLKADVLWIAYKNKYEFDLYQGRRFIDDAAFFINYIKRNNNSFVTTK